MNSELINKKKIFETIDLKKYKKQSSVKSEIIFNETCSDEMKIEIDLSGKNLLIKHLESNSCSIAEFGASVIINNIHNTKIDDVRKEIFLYKEAIEGHDNKYSLEFPFLKDLRLRKNCLLMFANYIERKINE